MYKTRMNLFLYLFLLSIMNFINNISCIEIAQLKIGLKSKKITFSEKQSIFLIKTNYFHLKLTINNFENIKRLLISDIIRTDSPIIRRCLPSSNICQCNQ
jgi:hypothetical protein